LSFFESLTFIKRPPPPPPSPSNRWKRSATEYRLTPPTASIPEPQREAWKRNQSSGFTGKDGFEKEVVRHVETTLARSVFNCDEHAAYSATSLAFRDRLILDWNRTQQRQTYRDSKRVYYFSLEFLMGRALDNAMLNVGQKDTAKGM
jgi:glycogen phosphorylase